SLSSVMIGTAARPTTILSAKFTSMNRNSRNVMVQAPFGVDMSLDGAGAAMSLPRYCRSARVRASCDATHGFPGMAIGHFDSYGATQMQHDRGIPPGNVRMALQPITFASSHH